jgi:3D (Asp-Asp-Asp) domain-containing protein
MLTAIMASILLCSQKSVGQGKPPVQKAKSIQVETPVAKSTKQYQLKVVATAYSTHPSENGGYTITSTGKKLGKGIVAVDPKVIPMGSKILIPGYGWGVAADVGGAIRGRHIDVCLTSRGSVGRWGRKKLTITVYPKSKTTK